MSSLSGHGCSCCFTVSRILSNVARTTMHARSSLCLQQEGSPHIDLPLFRGRDAGSGRRAEGLPRNAVERRAVHLFHRISPTRPGRLGMLDHMAQLPRVRSGPSRRPSRWWVSRFPQPVAVLYWVEIRGGRPLCPHHIAVSRAFHFANMELKMRCTKEDHNASHGHQDHPDASQTAVLCRCIGRAGAPASSSNTRGNPWAGSSDVRGTSRDQDDRRSGARAIGRPANDCSPSRTHAAKIRSGHQHGAGHAANGPACRGCIAQENSMTNGIY